MPRTVAGVGLPDVTRVYVSVLANTVPNTYSIGTYRLVLGQVSGGLGGSVEPIM